VGDDECTGCDVAVAIVGWVPVVRWVTEGEVEATPSVG
jgi:hypothetical protein